MKLRLGLKTIRPVGGASGVSAPVNTVAPSFKDGAGTTVTVPLVGQTVFISPGTWSNSPTGYSFSIAGNTGVNSGSWNPSDPLPAVLVQDADVGNAFTVTVTASNSAGSVPASSAATSATVDIDLTAAITAFTRTSASGVTPMTWSVTFGSNVYDGYYLRAKVYSDSGLSTLTQNVIHLLTLADMQSGATIDLASDGLTSIGATAWLQLTVETTSPNGIFHSYVYPTALSPTDAVSAMTWSATDKSANVTISGGNLVASASGTPGSVRGSRGIGSGKKVYWEVTGTIEGPAVADSTATFASFWGGAGGDGSATAAAAEYQWGNGFIFYNGTGSSAAGFTSGATLGVALDTTVSPPKVYFAKNNVWQQSGDPAAGTGGQAMASIGSPIYPAVQLASGQTATANFGTTPGGTSGFTYTPPTGFVAP